MDVNSADKKYLATMAKNEGVPLTKKEKETINKAFCGIMLSLFSNFQL